MYTPAFVLNGNEWRSGSRWRDLAVNGPNAGELTVTVLGPDQYEVHFKPATEGGQWTVHVALLGNGLVSQVSRGENSGERLVHEFVALNLSQAPLTKQAGFLEAVAKLPRPALASETKKLSIAAWVTRSGDDRPVQAVGGDLP